MRSVSGQRISKLNEAGCGQMVMDKFLCRSSGQVAPPDGNQLATGNDDIIVQLWDVSDGQEVRVLRQHEDGVVSLDFSPGGKLIATGGWDKSVILWDVPSGEALRIVAGTSSFPAISSSLAWTSPSLFARFTAAAACMSIFAGDGVCSDGRPVSPQG